MKIRLLLLVSLLFINSFTPATVSAVADEQAKTDIPVVVDQPSQPATLPPAPESSPPVAKPVSPPVATSAPAQTVVKPLAALPNASVDIEAIAALYMSALHISPTDFYVDVLNNTTDPVELKGIVIELSNSCTIQLEDFLLPGKYITYTSGVTNANGKSVSCAPRAVPRVPFTASLYIGEAHIQTIAVNADGVGKYLYWKSQPKEDQLSLSASYISQNGPYHPGVPHGYYPTPAATIPLEITEVMPRPELCAQSDARVECRKYIKIVNTGSVPYSLENLRIRGGSSSVSYIHSDDLGAIPAGGFRVISKRVSTDPSDTELKINSTDGAVWLEDAYGLVAYPSDVLYKDAELVANAGKSWALDESGETPTWRWALPSPSTRENHFVVGSGAAPKPVAPSDTRVPCKPGQYRSAETGRCRNITAPNQPKPCKEGQYRSEESGRCRSILSAVADTLKPCKEGQFRNPLTGRCKKLVSADDVAGLVPCAEGYERNPKTNRCRKIRVADMPKADFAVEPMKVGAKSFTAWWALGGVSALAAGYGTWEWRTELAQLWRRLLAKVGSHGGR